MELRIIGAGIAGSVLAVKARARGWDVEVIADPSRPPASRAAVGVLMPTWHPDAIAAAGWYREQGWLISEHGVYSSWRNENLRARPIYAVDVELALVEPDRHERWEENGDDVPTIIATGVHSPLAYRRRWGATLTGTTHRIKIVQVYEDRPRHAYSAVQVDGFGRLGSSIAKTEAEAVERLDGIPALIDVTSPDVLTGERAMPERGEQAGVWTATHRRWHVGVLGRVGFSAIPTLASTVLADIEEATCPRRST